MVCSMVKKGLIGAALGAGTLFLVFGTHAPSYVKTAVRSVKQNAKDAVPVEFDIERARDDIASLEPAIRDNIVKLARAEADVENLDKEIATIRTNMESEKKALLTLRESLKTGEYRLAGLSSVSCTEDEVKADLARRYDVFQSSKLILDSKVSTLKSKHAETDAFRKQLETMMAQKKALSTKLDAIQARMRQIEATQASNEFQIDGSALSRAKQTVAELEKKLDVMARTAQLEARYAEAGIPVPANSSRDVVKEIDNEFGQPTSNAKPGKSL